MTNTSYYVSHHGVTNAQITGQRTEEDRYDDGYSRAEIELRIKELIDEVIAGREFAEIMIVASGGRSYVIKFGEVGDLGSAASDV